jgi:hypothetical protein
VPKPLVLRADATVAGGSNPPRPERAHQWERHGSAYSRTVDYDRLYNKTTTYWYDPDARQQWLTETWHDISPVAEAAKAMRNATDENARWSPLGDGEETHMTHVAHFPVALIPDILAKTANGKDRAAVSRWLKDPANAPFLVRSIKVGV